MSNEKKMCDCNQGRLPCSCKTACEHLWRGLEAGNAQCDKCWAIKSADGSVSEPADELILPVAEQHQDAPTCRGDKRLGSGCGKCSRCVESSAPVERDELSTLRDAYLRAGDREHQLRIRINQLQADLTARDERIDQLEQKLATAGEPPALRECAAGYGHGGQWCGKEYNCWLDPRPRSERKP